MNKHVILLAGLCLSQYACCMKQMPSFASISVSSGVEKVLFENCHADCLRAFQDIGISQDDGDLYINVFNVGQGNFVVLRKENHAVIIDAGGGKTYVDKESEKVENLLDNVEIDAVFVSHPHSDHFSLFPRLFKAFPKSFLSTVFYLSGKESDWNTGIAQDFLAWLSSLSHVTSSIKYLDNEQFEISLLNGVIFKTFHLEPAVKREPNKLSLLLQVSYMGRNVLFTGDAEGDSNARLFQAVGDLSSVVSLVSDRNEIAKITELFSKYTSAYRDYTKLRSLCCSLAKTLITCIFDDRFERTKDLVDNLQYMLLLDTILFESKYKDKLENLGKQIFYSSEESMDPFYYFCCCQPQLPTFISTLDDLRSALSKTNKSETIGEFPKEEELLQTPLFSILKEYNQLKVVYIQELVSQIEESRSFCELSQAMEKILRIHDDLQLDLKLKQFVYEQLQYFSEAYADLLNEDLVELSSENFRAFAQNYLACFRKVNDILGNSISFNVPYGDTIDGVAYSKMKEWIFLNAKRSEFKNSHIVLLPHHGTNTKSSQNILGLFAGRDFRKPEEQRTFIVSSSPFGPDKLPKASTLEMAPFFSVHPVHKFIYCRDYSDLINMVDTEKPIYLTGASPAGVITVKVNQDGDAFVLDLISRGDGRLGWIHTLTGGRVAFQMSSPNKVGK